MSGTPEPDDAPVIALYAPYLQGFFIGELINQIRQLSFIKGYKLVIIRTGGYGSFNESIHLGNIDGAIIIRNAIAPDLAEALINNDIACVSIGYDYFPLKMPLVSSDNAHGTALAFDHLLRLGHTKIAYVGDLSHYEIRKRYEHYCELHDQHKILLREDYLFNLNDTFLSGGIKAAKAFIQNQCDATAVIFGSGLTGIGFAQHRRAHAGQSEIDLDYVCFDALSMIPVFTPEITSVDQNPHLVVYRAFNAIDAQMGGKDFEFHTTVTPKLTRVSENADDNAFIATCIDLPELHNPNYLKSLLCNMHDWPREILHSKLDQLMSIAPLFQRFMGRVVLSRYFIDTKNIAWAKIIKVYSPGEITVAELSDSSSLCKAHTFPPKLCAQEYQSYGTCIHVPIHKQGKIWGLLSFLGDPGCKTPASSYYGFAGYIESLVKMYEQELELELLRKRLHSMSETAQAPDIQQTDSDATIDWDLSANHTSWSDAALAKLGYTSAVEINIYRHMEITDRIHPDDFEKARSAVASTRSDKAPCQFRAKYRAKNNHYKEAILNGQPRLDSQNRLAGIAFSIDLDDSEQ